jgi:hypothetical protein
MLPHPHRAPDVITQCTTATDCNSHCANLILHFHVNESFDIWATREHLNSGGWRMDLFCGTRTRYEEHDAKRVASLVHGKYGRHPGSDPFKVFWGLDDPD